MWRKLGFDVAMGNELTLKSSVLFGTKNGGALTHVSSLWFSFFPILAVQHVEQQYRRDEKTTDDKSKGQSDDSEPRCVQVSSLSAWFQARCHMKVPCSHFIYMPKSRHSIINCTTSDVAVMQKLLRKSSSSQTSNQYQSKLPKLDLNIPQPLRLSLISAPLLNSELIRPPLRNILRLVIGEEHLQRLLNNPATSVIQHHNSTHSNLELSGEGHKAELLVDLGDELGRAAESHTRDHQDAVVHALVLLDGLAEGAALVVDGESRDLLDELQQVDGAVEERGLELALEVDGAAVFHGLELCHVLRDVDEGGDVDGELAEDGGDDVPVPDVVLRAFLGELFDGL
jgi:hypothetical protein